MGCRRSSSVTPGSRACAPSVHHLRYEALRPRFVEEIPITGVCPSQDRAPTDACDRQLWLQLHPETEAEQSVASLNCVSDRAGACPALKPAPRPATLSSQHSSHGVWSSWDFAPQVWRIQQVGQGRAGCSESDASSRVGQGPASPSSPSSPPGPAGAVAPAALGSPASPAKSCKSNRSGECGKSSESTNPDHSEAVRQACTPTLKRSVQLFLRKLSSTKSASLKCCALRRSSSWSSLCSWYGFFGLS